MRKKGFLVFSFIFFAFPLTTPARIFEQIPSRKWIALSFDDGPRPAETRKLLSVLSKYQVKATFFVVGKMAQKYPDSITAISREGHDLANHTWNHRNLRQMSRKQLFLELEMTRKFLYHLTGKNTYLFRTPGSTKEFLLKRFYVPMGYDLVLWTVHSHDQEGLSSTMIVDRVLSQVKGGDIILMHNGLGSTVEALDQIIPQLQSEGYQFVTISKLYDSPLLQAQLRQSSSIIRGS